MLFGNRVREMPSHKFSLGIDTEVPVNLADVADDGAGRDSNVCSDFLSTKANEEEVEGKLLAGRERLRCDG